MYTNGANEAKKWILAYQKLLKEERDEMNASLEDQIGNIEDEDDEEDQKSPFDILERIRDIVNTDLKDPEDDEEIEVLLKDVASEVKGYVSEDDENEPTDPENDEQQAQAPDMSLGTNPDDSDIGANSPGDMQTAMGGQLGGNFPASGGQM